MFKVNTYFFVKKSYAMGKPIPRIIKHRDFLNWVYSAPAKQRKEILKIAAKDQILAICECCYNLHKKNVDITPSELEQIRKFRRVFYDMCDPYIPVEEKREELIQEGGFAFIPAILAPIIGSLIGAAVSK